MSSTFNANDYNTLFKEFNLLLLLMSYTVLSVTVIQIEKSSIILFTASVSLLKISINLI